MKARNFVWPSRVFLAIPASDIRLLIASVLPIPGGGIYSLLRCDNSGCIIFFRKRSFASEGYVRDKYCV